MTMPEEMPQDTILGVPNPDDEAPWGRRADGSPRAKPGRKTDGPPARSPRRAAAPRARASSGPKPPKDDGPDYRMALVGLMALPVGLMAVAAKFARKEKTQIALRLNALTLKIHSPKLAQALHNTALTNAKLAAALDKVVAVGPYGEIIAVAAPIVLQMLVNHGKLDANPDMGIYPPDQLVAMVEDPK